MSGINKVILIGHLGNDPDVRDSNSGMVTTISVATSEAWKDRTTGDKKKRTEWHRVVFFGKLAEIAAQYLNKGSQVYIEGSIRTSKYTDKTDQERYSTSIHAHQLQMLGSASVRDDKSKYPPRKDKKPVDIFEDDIPF